MRRETGLGPMRTMLPLVVLLLGLAGCASPPSDRQVLGTVADFRLTERSGRPVTRHDLLGKVWVAAFVFTRCAGPCPQVSGTMARLQSELAAQPDVVLVSITVDPEHDTPLVLEAYAARYGADPDRWLFLTGSEKEVYDLIRGSFLMGVEQTRGEARTPGNEVIHSTKLAVVDRKGQLRGLYDGRQVDETGRPVEGWKQVVQRVRELLAEAP